jgi:hypothetical protein
MMLRRRFLLALLLPLSLSAQATPDGRRLTLGTDTLDVYLVRGADTSWVGRVVDELRVIEGGRLHRVYQSDNQVFGGSLDTLTDDLRTLRPIAIRNRTGRSASFFKFGRGRATGWNYPQNADSVMVDVPIDEGVFSGSSVDLVLRASPLSANWRGELPMFLSTSGTVAQFRAWVGGEVVIAGVPVWQVNADFAGMSVTFWIAKDSRRMLRQTMQLAPDAVMLYTKERGIRTTAVPGQRS